MAGLKATVLLSAFALASSTFFADLFLTAELSVAVAMPKSGKQGQACIQTGTQRRQGTDPNTKEKLDCLWDYCTYCKNGATDLNCVNAANDQGVRLTDFDNPRDCKVVASRPGGGAVVGPQTVDPGVLAPDTASPPSRGPGVFRPGGARPQLQQR